MTGGAKGDVSIWEIPSGKRIHHLRESGEAVDAVAFAPNGQLVAAASIDGIEQVWDAVSGQQQAKSSLHGKALSVEFDRTSSLTAAATSNGAVIVNDVVSDVPFIVLDGPSQAVKTAHFDPASKRVLGASWDGTARIWDATFSYRQWNSPSRSEDCGATAGLEPDRRFLAISCHTQPTQVWDTARNQLLAELPNVTPVEGNSASASPAVSIAGDRVAIARGNTVEVYELPSAKLLRTIRHDAPVTAVAFAAEGRDIVSGAASGSVIVMRDNGAFAVLPSSLASVDAVGLLTGGRVVVADAQRHLRIYDVGGSLLADLRTQVRVVSKSITVVGDSSPMQCFRTMAR